MRGCFHFVSKGWLRVSCLREKRLAHLVNTERVPIDSRTNFFSFSFYAVAQAPDRAKTSRSIWSSGARKSDEEIRSCDLHLHAVDMVLL